MILISLRRFAFGLALILALPLSAILSPVRADVLIFAAASTTDAVNAINTAFNATGRGKATGSFAASSALARQIENGAPAAVFLSADQQWMNYVAEKKLIVESSRTDLLGNSLVLIAPKDSNISLTPGPNFPLAQALGNGRLSTGDPASVPVGIYAKTVLTNLGVWDSVKDKVAPAADVRAALAFVERGETPLGIVYSTDAAISDKVKVIATFPANSGPPIVYPAALIAGKDGDEAKAYFAFLRGPEAKKIFGDYGFVVK